MDPVLPTASPAVTDGFGQRMSGIDSETGEQVELLEFSPQIVEHSGFVTALAERVAKFASVRHASYVHMRRLDRPSADRLQLVSDLTPGWRLSEMLEESAAAQTPIDISIVIGLLRQLLPAVALFSRHNREAAIGALSPHRLIVTPQARLVIAEYGFGPAIEKLNLGREKLWRDYRVSMPPSTGLPRANPRADANAIGVVALTLLLGRSLELDEYPDQVEALLEGAQEHRDGKPAPMSASFRNWLRRALQIDADKAFQSPSEGQLAFESVLASDRSYVTASTALANWVGQIGGVIDTKRRPETPAPAAAPEPAAVAEPAAAAVRETPAPAQEIEINIDDLIEQSPSALAQDAREKEEQPQEGEEVEIPLDEPEPVAAGPEPVAEPEPEPEPEPVKVEASAEEEEDPIVKQLRTYQPKVERPKPPKVEEEEDPIVKQLRTYQPKYEAPPPPPPPPPPPVREPEPVPVPEPEPEPEPVQEEPVPEPVAQEAAEEEVAEEVAAEPQHDWAPPKQELPPPQFKEPPRYEPPPPPPAPRMYEPPPAPRMYEEPPTPAPTYEEQAPEQPAVYEPEEAPPPPAAAPPPPPRAAEEPVPVRAKGGLNPLVLGLGAVVLVLVAAVGWLLTRGGGDGGLNENVGELVVQSRPEGAQVKIDGEVKGVTPLTIRLDRGAHVLEVQTGNSEPRVIPLMIQGGVQTSQYVELTGSAATGGLEIVSQPAGARIIIDGQNRGTTPSTVRDLSPGDHSVVLELRGRKVTQTVKIQAGTTSKLSVPIK